MSLNRNFFEKDCFGYLQRKLDHDFLQLLDNPAKIQQNIDQIFYNLITITYNLAQSGNSRDADQQLISILNILIDILVRERRKSYPQKFKNDKELVSRSVYDAVSIMYSACGVYTYRSQDYTEIDRLLSCMDFFNIDDADKSKLTEAFAELRKIASEYNTPVQNQAPQTRIINKFFPQVSTKVDGEETDKQSNKFVLRKL